MIRWGAPGCREDEEGRSLASVTLPLGHLSARPGGRGAPVQKRRAKRHSARCVWRAQRRGAASSPLGAVTGQPSWGLLPQTQPCTGVGTGEGSSPRPCWKCGPEGQARGVGGAVDTLCRDSPRGQGASSGPGRARAPLGLPGAWRALRGWAGQPDGLPGSQSRGAARLWGSSGAGVMGGGWCGCDGGLVVRV